MDLLYMGKQMNETLHSVEELHYIAFNLIAWLKFS